ncbi:hypothetical protein [Pseudophaeobacter sp.]|uniref:hypothetical protein n=1 Tax=Pseudophaeobacter sp. TaxID=1971739 RepID=UPI0032998C95
MSASAIVWFEDFQLTQNAGGALSVRFQNGHRNTSLIGLATSVGSSVPTGANGCCQPEADVALVFEIYHTRALYAFLRSSLKSAGNGEG